MQNLFPELEATFDADAVLSGPLVGRILYQSTQDIKAVYPQVVVERTDGLHTDTFGKKIETFNLLFRLVSRGPEPDNNNVLRQEFSRVFDNTLMDSYLVFTGVLFEIRGIVGPVLVDEHYETELEYECMVEYI